MKQVSIKLTTAAIALAAGLAMGAAVAQTSGGPGSTGGTPAADGANRAGAPSGDSMMGRDSKGVSSVGKGSPSSAPTGASHGDAPAGMPAATGGAAGKR